MFRLETFEASQPSVYSDAQGPWSMRAQRLGRVHVGLVSKLEAEICRLRQIFGAF